MTTKRIAVIGNPTDAHRLAKILQQPAPADEPRHGEPEPLAPCIINTCGNCQQDWPCECDSPYWICGVCGGDSYDCRCGDVSDDIYAMPPGWRDEHGVWHAPACPGAENGCRGNGYDVPCDWWAADEQQAD